MGGGLNLYGYVGNSPSNFIDQSGLCPLGMLSNYDLLTVAFAFAAAAALLFLALSPFLIFLLPEIIAATLEFSLTLEEIESASTVTSLAGYELGSYSFLSGETYNIFIWGLYRIEGAGGGPFALLNALRAEAAASGASQISIYGLAIRNPIFFNLLSSA